MLRLYAFLLTADPGGSAAEKLLERELGHKTRGGVEEEAALALRLANRMRKDVSSRGLLEVYEKIDLPLSPVLARMESNGIRIEQGKLSELSRRMESDIEQLTGTIHGEAGHTFNINSPQQLGKVLFEEIELPAPQKSGKTKSFSTAADVLEGLASKHRIAGLVLEYRQLVKLKGTYVDALPALVNKETGRIHTTFQPVRRGHRPVVFLESELAEYSDSD